MDITLLKRILEEHFNDVEINEYDEKGASVIKIAEEAVNNTENFSYKIVNDSKILFFYKGIEAGGINGQNLLTNKREGTLIARDKFKAEEHLKEKNIKTTSSIIYDLNQFEDAKIEIQNHQGPFVLKPYNLSSGKGVSLNVDADNIKEAWEKSVDAYGGDTTGASLIMQPQLPGIEARFLVINEKFSSAILRVPTNMVGDGKSTIEELIKQKNHLRAKNPHLKKFMIKSDDELENYLKKRDLSPGSVLENKELVFFTEVSNIALGGDTLEISHLVSDDLKHLAEAAVKAIPALKSAGVDIMFSSFQDKEASVLELNHAANLIMHYYPWKGQPQQPIHDYISSLYEEMTINDSFKNKGINLLKKLLSK
ncbi:ATP-grasp domain-containing protein [Salinicoccus kekensis]|uniref:Phosphoribosylglycinamide synthetase-like protein n=1 Tax=Salinicoccus kekensis TaxID=714307 RepID=A0A285UIF2_9STAP|nr:ATP-grasp domain-containing protein [Salinicoccus kekensis]SOC41188.1 phosphoribosylglycinamide synthetase-like protein [Salinicoccus kekensis]